MFGRQNTKKDDTADLISEMGQDLEETHEMVRKMQKWAGETGLVDLTEALRVTARAINEATATAQDAYRAAADRPQAGQS